MFDFFQTKKNVNSNVANDVFDTELIVCPRCDSNSPLSFSEDQFCCGFCDETYPVQNGIPVLLKDKKARTKLEKVDYDFHHQIDEARCVQLYKSWERIFNKYGIDQGNLLEIGCGTGFLTYGLVKYNRFDKVYVSDISPSFLLAVKERISGMNNNNSYYACDANWLPFQKDGFDTVVGNSVLHHFLNYQGTLERCYKILKPGGYVIFFEPVIQGKIVVAFMIDMMVRMNEEMGLNIFSNSEIENMKKTTNHYLTVPKLKNKKKKLAKLEDKYVFDMRELEEIARNIGYRNVDFVNLHDKFNFDYEPFVNNTLAYHRIDREKIEKFKFLFQCFSSTVGDIMGDTFSTPMVFIVLQK